MRPMTAQGLCLLALLVAATSAQADQWTKTYAVSGTPELRMETGDGNLHVSRSEHREIAVRVETRNWTIGEGGLRVEERQNGDRVEVFLHFPHRVHFSFGIDRPKRVDIWVQVPRDANLDLHTADGSIELEGIRGDLRLDTSDGHVEADDVDGNVRIHTGDGHVRVRGRFDILEVRSGDGRVEATALAGSKLAAGWSLTTADGSMELVVPKDLAADVEIHTGDGHVDTDLPITIAGRWGGHDLRGQLNGGGPPLRLRSGDGSIYLRTGGTSGSL